MNLLPFRSARVVAAARLHFGLLSFGHPHARQFGGTGVMISPPPIELTAVPAARFQASGQEGTRVAEFARHWSVYHRLPLPAVHLSVAEAPAMHTGLGTGTQLALAVASVLGAVHGLAPPTAAELAGSVGRGLRSAVGTYGFLQGGWIWEKGKLPGEWLSPLTSRLTFPDAWRFVLLSPPQQHGLSGVPEREAFARLPPVPQETTTALVSEVEQHMLPALKAGSFAAFAASVDRYGERAGSCFAAVQGGPFDRALQAVVQRLRQAEVPCVAQSSWGPTLFVLVPHAEAAQQLTRWCGQQPEFAGFTCTIAAAVNRGARVEIEEAT